MATVATQLLSSYNLEERISLAQGARSKLETLDVRLESGIVAPAQAADELIKCIEAAPFV